MLCAVCSNSRYGHGGETSQCFPPAWAVQHLCSLVVRLMASVTRWHGEEDQTLREGDFFPTGVWSQEWDGDGDPRLSCVTCRGKPFWKWGQTHVLCHGEQDFCSSINSKVEARTVQSFGCLDGIWFVLVMQRFKVMKVPAKCKFVFCLIMTSLS